MVSEQTIHELHELHEERRDLVIWCKKLQHKQAAIDSKQGWLLAFWFIGLPLLVVLALKNSSIPPTIEQQIFWAVVILGATAFAIVLHRRAPQGRTRKHPTASKATPHDRTIGKPHAQLRSGGDRNS